MTAPRGATRYDFFRHAAVAGLVVFLPLMRLGWDFWAQALVTVVGAGVFVLGCGLALLGRSVAMENIQAALKKAGPLWALYLSASMASALAGNFPQSAWHGVLNDFVAWGFWTAGAGVGADRYLMYRRSLAGAGAVGVLAAFLAGGTANPAAGPLINGNLFAALILLTLPLVIDEVTDSNHSPRRRLVWAVAAGAMALALLTVGSMGALAVVGVMGLFWIFCGFFSPTNFLPLRRAAHPGAMGTWGARGTDAGEGRGKGIYGKYVWLGVGGLVLFLVAGFYLAKGEWWKWAGEGDRIIWATSAIKMFCAHPLLGAGPGSFGEAYPLFRVDPWGLNSLYAHNFILELLAERGLIGASAMLVMMVVGLIKVWRRGDGRVGLAVGLTAFCLFNLAHIGFSIPGLNWLFFFGLGLAFRQQNNSVDPTPVSARYSKKWIAGAGAIALGVGLTSGALFRSEQLYSRGKYVYAQGEVAAAGHWASQSLAWNPRNAAAYELRAAVHMRSAHWDLAATDLDHAIRWAPSSAGLRMERAELALQRGNADDAIADYTQATGLLPLKVSAWERLGDLWAARSDAARATQAYGGAIKALSDPRVLGGREDLRDEVRQRVQKKLESLHG